MEYTTTTYTVENPQVNTTNANNINHVNIVTSLSSTSSSLSSSSESSGSSTSALCQCITSATNGVSSGSISGTGCIGISSCLNTAATTTNTIGSENALFCEQVNSVTNLFEKWNDCEQTVVMYALLKRVRYPSLKFLQYSIDSTLTQNMDSTSNLSTVVVDTNANNASYLQNLLNAYKTFHLGDLVDTLSSSSSDKDSITCYGSDFQITHCDDRRLYNTKEDILHEVLNMLPLLKPGNEEAKAIYLSLIPMAVKDTIKQVVPTELMQQIFSYMIIHPAVSSEDRRNLTVWLHHLEDHIQNFNHSPSLNMGTPITLHTKYMQNQNSLIGGLFLDNSNMTTSDSSVASSASSAMSISSSASSLSAVSSTYGHFKIFGSRSNDWQTIQPPCKQQQQQLSKNPLSSADWPASFNVTNGNTSLNSLNGCSGDGVGVSVSDSAGAGGIKVGSTRADQFCDNLNGIALNDLASSQNSLGLNIVVGNNIVDSLATTDDSSNLSLVNGVAAAAAYATEGSSVVSTVKTPNIFGPQTNPIINIINNNNNCSNDQLGNNIDDHDTSFSKNGTEILDFDPNTTTNGINNCDSCSSSSGSNIGQNQPHQPMGYASILMNNCSDHLDINRWSLDSKIAALKTRRSNSLTTQTISSSASSSNSSVITVNDNCSNSTENLAQFANKPRSFSLSIENHRGSLTNSGSDTRLDDFKPNYIKFQTRNVGMSSIGLWLKSLRLHKYIDLFKNMTYEDMLQITEDYLQSLGVTKGASHKLAICIEKLKDRFQHLTKMEHELLNGQLKLQAAVEELAHIVLTPMKPIEQVNSQSGEDNVALAFFKVVELVCNIAQKDPYAVVDDDNISVILWILDRSIHNEAFVNHVSQLKELKFKLSKLKMSLAPKCHHTKNGSNGSLNKPRWNSKSRKYDQKNGSNDRINHRKNSNDMLNFSLTCLHQHAQQMQKQQQQQQNNNNNSSCNNNNNNNNNSNSYNNNNNNNQHKNSSYQNYQQQSQQHIKHQQQSQIQQQHVHFSTLSQQQQQQHRRSLSNLVIVSGGPQQPQKMVFKPGQGILTTTTTTNDDLLMDMLKSNQQQQHKHQCRKGSLTIVNNNNGCNSLTVSNLENLQHLHQQQLQKLSTTKSAMAVVVSNDDLMRAATTNSTTAGAAVTNTAAANVNIVVAAPPPPPPQILITQNNHNHNSMLQQQQKQLQQQQHHVLQQQQQQQLQLLAAAAAAVGNSCNLNIANIVNCNSNNNSNDNKNIGANLVVIGGNGGSGNNVSSASIINCTNNSNNNNCKNNLNNVCNNCSNHPLQTISATTPQQTSTNFNLNLHSLNESQYRPHHNLPHSHRSSSPPINDTVLKTSSLTLNNNSDTLNDITGFEQLETLCLQMTEQAIN